MNVPQKITKNTIVILSGQIITLTLNMIVMIYIARYLGEEKYGMFSFAIAFINLFAIFGNFGMKPIIIREISGDRTNARKILGTAIIVKLFLAIVSIVSAILAAYLLGYKKQLIILIAILSVNILISYKLTTFRFVFEAIYESELRMEYPIVFRIIDALLLLVLILLISLFNLSLTKITLFYVLSAIPGFLLTLIFSFKYFKPDFSLDFNLAKWLFVESCPLALYVGLNTLYLSSDIFLLKTLVNDAAVGFYSAAFRLVYPLSFIPTAIVMSLFPLMSKYFYNSQKKLLKLFYSGIKILVLIGMGMGLVTTFYFKEIIKLLYSSQYLAAAVPLMLLMWAELFFFLNFFFSDFNTSIHQQQRNMYAVFIMLLVNVILNIIIIPVWGINGASIVRVATNMLGFILLHFFISKKIKISLMPIFIKLIPILVIFSACLYLARNLFIFPIVILSPIVYLIIVLMFHYFSSEELTILKEIFAKIRIKI